VGANAVGGTAVGANATVANAVETAEAPTTPADVEDLLYNCGDEDYPPQAMIAKSTTANEDKPTYEEAMASSEGPQWRKGIDKELNRIRELGVWELVPKPRDIKIFTSKWALARKRNEHNEVVRHKARLVLRGYEQVAGRDYDETYAGVVRSETSRLLLSLAAKYDWEVDQMDAVSAFLNSEADREIHMWPPKGANIPKGMVCKLNLALYGMKQSAKLWSDTYSKGLRSKGYI